MYLLQHCYSEFAQEERIIILQSIQISPHRDLSLHLPPTPSLSFVLVELQPAAPIHLSLALFLRNTYTRWNCVLNKVK